MDFTSAPPALLLHVHANEFFFSCSMCRADLVFVICCNFAGSKPRKADFINNETRKLVELYSEQEITYWLPGSPT